LTWNPSLSPNIAGYRLHSGTTSGVYSQTIELGNATSTLASNLVTGKTYFFVVTAYNTMGVESARSNEVSYLAPPTTGPAQMVSPAPGSTFTSSSVTFNWSAGSATAYFRHNPCLFRPTPLSGGLTRNRSSWRSSKRSAHSRCSCKAQPAPFLFKV